MEGNLFTFDSKKLPKAFIVFLSLVILTETISLLVIKKLPSRHCLQRVLNTIARDEINADILILGDSFALTAFYNKDKIFPGTDELMSKTISLATNADISMAGQYFILKRYLKKNQPPTMIFLISTPFLWDTKLKSLTDNYFASCFINKDEIADILSSEKNLKLLIRMLYYKLLPSAKYSLYLAEFQGKSETVKRRMLEYLKDIILVKIRLKSKSSLQVDMVEINKPLPLVAGARSKKIISQEDESLKVPNTVFLNDKRFQNKDRNFSICYFDKICKLLKQKGVKLYYVDSSITYSLFRLRGEYFISGKDFVKTLQEKNSSFIHLKDFTPLYLEDKYFFDGTHLNAVGAEYYLRIFHKALQNLVQSEK